MALCNIHFIGFAILFVGLINSGEGIKCWECNSVSDYNCRDPFNFTVHLQPYQFQPVQLHLVNCDTRKPPQNYLQYYPVCRKTVHRVSGELRVERACDWEPAYNSRDNRDSHLCSSVKSSPYATLEHCSTCNTDACNGGSGVMPAVTTVAVSIISYMGLKFM